MRKRKIFFQAYGKSALAFLELSPTLLQLNELAVHVANGLLTLGKARLKHRETLKFIEDDQKISASKNYLPDKSAKYVTM
jgi:hypothetical protein